MNNADARDALREDDFVRTFITNDKQCRWLDGLPRRKHRRKLLGELNHPRCELFCCNKYPLKLICDADNIAADRVLYIIADSSRADMLSVDLDKFKLLFNTGVLSGSIASIDSKHAILVSEDTITLLCA